MKRAFLPCLLVGLLILGSKASAQTNANLYFGLNIGNGYYSNPGYVPYQPNYYYPPNYQPYNQLWQWVQYLDQRWNEYDRFWYGQSYWFRNQTRMQHDYGYQLLINVKRYPSQQTISQMEMFFQRYFDPYAYSYNRQPDYDDPYYGNYDSGTSYYYPPNYYYNNTPTRVYYGDPYNYYNSTYATKNLLYGLTAGNSVSDIVAGSYNGNNLQTVSGSLGTVSSILGMVSNQQNLQNAQFGRYYRY